MSDRDIECLAICIKATEPEDLEFCLYWVMLYLFS